MGVRCAVGDEAAGAARDVEEVAPIVRALPGTVQPSRHRPDGGSSACTEIIAIDLGTTEGHVHQAGPGVVGNGTPKEGVNVPAHPAGLGGT